MPIECYSGWLQDDTFGGPSAEGVNRFEGSQQICTWRNLLGGTQYGECFPHAMEVILGPKSVAWVWRNCSLSGRVLQDLAEAPNGLGAAQTRRLIQEYRARQAFCDFGPWSYAFRQLLNNNWRVKIDQEWSPYWIDCAEWTAVCYVQTAQNGSTLIPETRTLPGWSGANQIPLTVSSAAAEAAVVFNPIGSNMSCQLVYRDTSGNVRYGAPVSSGTCSIPLANVKNNVIVAVICNTDYIYRGETTRTAKFNYSLTLGAGIVGKADIYTKWYDHTPTNYTIKASAGANGTINPSGNITVGAGASRTFTFTPASGCRVDKIILNGFPVGALNSYTFHNVRGNYTISAIFRADEDDPPAAPTNLTAVADGSRIMLDWADNTEPDLASYTVYRRTAGGSYKTLAAGITTSAYTDKAAANGVAYFYAVAALDTTDNQSALSSAVSAAAGPDRVAYYKMEGNAADSSGNGNDAASSGDPAYCPGHIGQAVDLNGVDNLIALPANIAVSNAITVSAWINWDGGSAWQRIFDFGNGTSQYLFLTPSNGSVMRFAVKNGGSEQTLSASPPAVGQWVHVAIALNGSVGTLYVNGSPKATHSSMTIRPSDFNPSQNYIGKSQFSADPLFDGRIDDFRIYNYALSSSEIAAVYAASLLPPPPHFDGTAVSASRIDLSWDAVPGAAGYKIARSTASGGPYESVDDSAIGTTCSDTDLLGNLTYYYVIASVNEIGPGAYSPEIAVTTLPGQPTPWQGIVRPIPGQIEAEYYDDGGQNVSYYDTTPGNSGGQFSRIYGGVDLFASSDVGGGYAVGDIQSGEWLLYTVTSSASEVSLYARLASLQSGNQIRVLLDDVPLAVVEVPNTGSLSAWATVSVEGVSLPDSSHALLKLEFTGSDFRVNWVAFQSQSPYLGYPSALPGRIQFEDFDSGGQNISYYDTTAGNTYEEYRSDEDVDIMSVPGGYGVYMSPGEWMEYTCTSEPGLYTMSIRHASNQKTQTLRLSDESAVLAEVELPKTGGYSNWQDTLVSDVFLSGGQGHILRFTMAASTALLDYVDFIRQENPADFDGSGFVDLEDFSILSSQWLREPSEPSADAAPQGGDNWVDLQDLIALTEYWLSY
jgi:hypothetical protein